MGQRRPKPEEPRSGYITSEGYARMSEEFEQLYRVERPKVVKGVAVAAAEGDRSENAEYIYGKKKLREIDRRLRHLGQRLNAVTVVEPNEDRDDGKVYFGAWVRLESETGEQLVLRIVGPDEFDGKRGFISMDSPVAKAILRSEEGDLVKVERPRGTTTFEIVEVSYRPLT
jgi:transcription elongation factor GreB